MTNADFGNTRGVDLRLDRRFGNLFNGTLSYTFQQAKNTGSDPDTYLDFGSRVLNQVSGGNQPPPQAILPTDFSRPHNLAIAAALNFPNDWQQGSIIGIDAGERRACSPPSGTPAARRTPAASRASVTRTWCRATTAMPVPRSAQQLAGCRRSRIWTFGSPRALASAGMDLTGYVEARNVLNFKQHHPGLHHHQ